ncbi:hypothetical protein DP73_03810 [Desulfosporosinus sp. HMP52]|nr:hypothetical protein DP73_03810 [Desulfosporosinus sp. HMP52]
MKKEKFKITKKDKAPVVNELGLPFYDEYEMSKKEKVGYSLLAGMILFLIGYLFYMNPIISLGFSLLGLFFPKIRRKQIIAQRKDNLTNQFKFALASISSSLSAGKSVENAFRSSLDDLKLLFPDDNTDILRELKWIVAKVDLNEPLEQALQDFAQRANIEEIFSFAEVFTTCKRTGGNLVEVVRKTTVVIQEKLEIKNEIKITLAAKKMEQKGIVIVPFFIIGYLALATGDFMTPMYNTLQGRIVMTVGWVVIAVIIYVSDRIMDIRV